MWSALRETLVWWDLFPWGWFDVTLRMRFSRRSQGLALQNDEWDADTFRNV
jgi:hypothetical protein